MKIEFKIMPRRAGKTTECIKLLAESPNDSILIVRDYEDTQISWREDVRALRGVSLNIFYSEDVEAIEQALNTGNIKNVIIDEFLVFESNISKKLHQLAHRAMQNMNIKIFSSFRKRYDVRIFDMITDYKAAHSSSLDCPFQDEEAKELYYSFLTDSQTTMRVSLLNTAGVDYGTSYVLEKNTPIESFLTEFQCVLFK
jgi:hypothetical protein